ncbi:MAG TPA: hypothetical protein VF368_09650 [Gemmatimonadaceae bacterium]|jgi:hypothetical protein
MTPLAIGALLAVAAMVWVIAPIFGEKPADSAPDGARSSRADDAAEAAIRRFREPKE